MNEMFSFRYIMDRNEYSILKYTYIESHYFSAFRTIHYANQYNVHLDTFVNV